LNKSILTYEDILNSDLVTKFLPNNCGWWKNYVYHFSDVKNIAKILETGIIYSRKMAIQLNLMENNNASRPVMDGTDNDIKDFVRFYFRPLTPTQFHNEGIRAKEEIHTGHLAHCPVPVFLLFDIVKMLNRGDSQFTYEGLASNNVDIYNTTEDFANAPFKYIYHKGSYNPETEYFIKKNRQAELIIPQQCDLDELVQIICRTDAERETLLDLLSENQIKKYYDKIGVIKHEAFQNMFLKDYLIIESVELGLETLNINIINPNHYKRAFYTEIISMSGEIINSGFNKEYIFSQDRIILPHFSKDKLKSQLKARVRLFIDDNLVYTSIKTIFR